MLTKIALCQNNDRGAALVLVLIMLTLLSLLGTMALDSTKTETMIAGSFSRSQDALQTAIRASDVAETDETIYSSIGMASIDLDDSGAAVNPGVRVALIENSALDAADAGLTAKRMTNARLYTPPAGQLNFETTTDINSDVAANVRYVPTEPSRIEFLSSGPLPPGSGSDPSYFQARYYRINVQTQLPDPNPTHVDANGNPLPLEVARIESTVARVVPK